VRWYWHGIGMDNTILKLDWPWRGTSAIRAPGRIHEGTHKATTVGLDDRRGPRSTFRWKWTIYMQYLGESSENLQQRGKRLTLIKSWRSVRPRARIWLVVAPRLQAQHPSLRLRTSNNTPSVLMNDAQGSFANFQQRKAFSLLQLLF
jgi:hypothetical protein